jgi:Na+/proline symporter
VAVKKPSAGVVLLVAFVFASGVRAVAWVSVVKDALMVIAAVSIMELRS